MQMPRSDLSPGNGFTKQENNMTRISPRILCFLVDHISLKFYGKDKTKLYFLRNKMVHQENRNILE